MAYKDKRELTIHTDFPQFGSANTMQVVNGSFRTKLPQTNSMRTVFRGSLPDESSMPTRPDHFFQPPSPISANGSWCCSCCRQKDKQSTKTVMC
jgi:hypothetical protein